MFLQVKLKLLIKVGSTHSLLKEEIAWRTSSANSSSSLAIYLQQAQVSDLPKEKRTVTK